jgi:hypothetical protein
MKTIKNGIDIRRVTDKEATFLVKKGWNYCPKTEFKNLHGKNVVTEGSEVEMPKKRKAKKVKIV